MNQPRLGLGLRFVVILFVGSRLMMLAAFTPEAIAAYGDYEHYFNLARLSRDGFLPFLHYWYEFPPVFPFLSLGLYWLTAATTDALHSYLYALAITMLVFDAGSLVLLYRISDRLWGSRTATLNGLVYVALPVGLVYSWRTFDSMTTFWMLLALYWLLRAMDDIPHGRRWNLQSAVALGVGTMTKYLPVLLLPTAWAFLPIRRALRYTLVLVLVALLIFGPFLVISPEFGFASLRAQAAKSSWQTVWALIDGNYGTGNVGPDVEHFDASLATKLQGNPERIPGWLTLIPFAAVGFYFFYRARQAALSDDPTARPLVSRHLQAVDLFTLTFALFLLWSKGWSPQWQIMLFPLILLAFPGRNGTFFCILLGLVSFLEWPILLSRGMTEWLWVTIMIRTVLLLGLAIATAQSLLRGWEGVGSMETVT
jgi:4-amino-4-deoxy-L-arabinose transferase-like glycosyltransferase